MGWVAFIPPTPHQFPYYHLWGSQLAHFLGNSSIIMSLTMNMKGVEAVNIIMVWVHVCTYTPNDAYSHHFVGAFCTPILSHSYKEK